jgi:hypothetical protein
MSRTSKQLDSRASALPSSPILSMPRSFYTPTDRKARWISFDPLFRAECKAVYRSIRFTLLTLFALMASPKSSKASGVQRTGVEFTQAIDRHTRDAGGHADCAHRVCICREMPTADQKVNRSKSITARTLAVDAPKRNVPDLRMHRAHAPPAIEPLTGLRASGNSRNPHSTERYFSRPNLPLMQRALTYVAAPGITKPKSSWLQFEVERSHAPPAPDSCFQLRPSLSSAPSPSHPQSPLRAPANPRHFFGEAAIQIYGQPIVAKIPRQSSSCDQAACDSRVSKSHAFTAFGYPLLPEWHQRSSSLVPTSHVLSPLFLTNSTQGASHVCC